MSWTFSLEIMFLILAWNARTNWDGAPDEQPQAMSFYLAAAIYTTTTCTILLLPRLPSKIDPVL